MSKLRIDLFMCFLYFTKKKLYKEKFKIFIKITGKKQELAKRLKMFILYLCLSKHLLLFIHFLSLRLFLSVTVFLALFIGRISLFDFVHYLYAAGRRGVENMFDIDVLIIQNNWLSLSIFLSLPISLFLLFFSKYIYLNCYQY